MTKIEAKRTLSSISSGTLAILTGKTLYREIEEILFSWLEKIEHMNDSDFCSIEMHDYPSVLAKIIPEKN